jgi:RNA polymerase sigma factor (sigma-70 family)
LATDIRESAEGDMEPQHKADFEGADPDRVSPDIGALYEEHRDVMYRMARSLLRGDDRHRAEDVVQDVMVSLLPRLPTGIRNWEAFLVNAVKMKAYDLLKSAAHRHEVLVLDDARPLEGERHGGDDVGLDPAEVISARRDRESTVAEVRGALAELDRRVPDASYVYRQVKELGRTSQDVAEELGVSGSRVRQLVMKARKELFKIITDARGGGDCD